MQIFIWIYVQYLVGVKGVVGTTKVAAWVGSRLGNLSVVPAPNLEPGGIRPAPDLEPGGIRPDSEDEKEGSSLRAEISV